MATAVSVSETSPELAPLLGGPTNLAEPATPDDDSGTGAILPAPATARTSGAEADDDDDGGASAKKKKKKKKDADADDDAAALPLAQYGDYGTLTGAQRKASKAVADILKTEMAAERTFFKWLWTGLHTGAIGSIIFAIFDSRRDDPARLLVIGFSWLVALALVLYGALVYYRRRAALRSGDIGAVPRFTREHSPAVVVVALVAVVGVSMSYAIVSRGAGGGAGDAGGVKNGTGSGLLPFGLRLR